MFTLNIILQMSFFLLFFPADSSFNELKMLFFFIHLFTRTSLQEDRKGKTNTDANINRKHTKRYQKMHFSVYGPVQHDSASDRKLSQTFRCWYNLNWMINIPCWWWCPMSSFVDLATPADSSAIFKQFFVEIECEWEVFQQTFPFSHTLAWEKGEKRLTSENCSESADWIFWIFAERVENVDGRK